MSTPRRSVCLTWCLWALPLAASQLPRAEQERLWNAHIRDKPNPRILDDLPNRKAKWEIIEGMVVIRQVKGLTPLGAALATVAIQTCGVRITQCGLTEKNIRRFGEKWKGADLTADEKARLTKVYERVKKEYWRRHPEKRKGVVFDITFFIRDAKLLQQVIKGRDSVAEALREVARLHGYVPVLESGENLPFRVYKEAIDKRIPVLMERALKKRSSLLPGFGSEREYAICFGYLVVEGREYLAVLDCAAVPFEKRSPHLTQKTLESDHPAVKSYVARALRRRITADYETGTGKPLSPGVSIRPFRDASSCRVHLIYQWGVTPEGIAGQIQKALRGECKGSVRSWLQTED